MGRVRDGREHVWRCFVTTTAAAPAGLLGRREEHPANSHLPLPARGMPPPPPPPLLLLLLMPPLWQLSNDMRWPQGCARMLGTGTPVQRLG
eukprot:104784-Chlamydomonas_euryale.AAC.2